MVNKNLKFIEAQSNILFLSAFGVEVDAKK